MSLCIRIMRAWHAESILIIEMIKSKLLSKVHAHIFCPVS